MDHRAKTSKENGKRGGRPIESEHFEPIDDELWKAIDENYMISDQGRILSVRSGKLRKTHPNKYGYPAIRLPKIGLKTLHSLVALAFLGPRPDGLEIDHLNSDKTDSRLTNLEYVTKSVNIRRATEQVRGKYWGISKGNNKKNPWLCKIKFDGKWNHIGYFKSRDDAVVARDRAEILLKTNNDVRKTTLNLSQDGENK